MRAKEIPQHLQAAVRKHFPEDVAAAINGDSDALGAAAYNAGVAADTPQDLDNLIKSIASQVDDRLADWLVDDAEAPAAWLASQLRAY